MDDIVVAARYMFPNDAEMAKLRLESEGIECLIGNQMTSQLTTAPGSMGGIVVQVHRADLERAVTILGTDAVPRATMTNSTPNIADEVPFDKKPDEAFECVKEVIGHLGKIKSIDHETLTINGELGGWLSKLKLQVQIKPEGDKSMLLISVQGGDTLAKTAMKWINKIYDELGIEDE
ncbi:MAG: DUF2007 domain-containing protein [Armatimonadota bacterium]